MPGPWGTPQQTLRQALCELDRANVTVRGCSCIYRSRAYGVDGQPDYLNAVVEVSSFAPPEALLGKLHKIEKKAARARGERWGARTLDLDLLDWKGRIVGSGVENGRRGQLGFKKLSLPHPGIVKRPFVMMPLAELLPNWHHPLTGEIASQIAKRVNRGTAGGILDVLEF